MGGEATKKEQAVLYDGGSETYDLSGFLWEKIFNYTKPGAIFADKRCNFGGGEATKKEQAVLYDEGMSPEEEIEAMGFEIFDDNHARSLFQSMSAANGPKIFHKN